MSTQWTYATVAPKFQVSDAAPTLTIREHARLDITNVAEDLVVTVPTLPFLIKFVRMQGGVVVDAWEWEDGSALCWETTEQIN